jgi:hypothetical protein
MVHADRAFLEERARLIHQQRWQGIFAPPRRLEHIAAVDLVAVEIAGLAGHAQIVFGAVVKRFEVGIAERPVRERGVRRDRGHAIALDGVGAGAEIVLVEPP